MKYLFALLCILAYFAAPAANATCTTQTVNKQSDYVIYSGSCTADNEILIIASVAEYDACRIISSTGAVDIAVSLDGSNYTTAPLSLNDEGATDTSPVIVTVALRSYSFAARFARVKIQENGATDAAAAMLCWKY